MQDLRSQTFKSPKEGKKLKSVPHRKLLIRNDDQTCILKRQLLLEYERTETRRKQRAREAIKQAVKSIFIILSFSICCTMTSDSAHPKRTLPPPKPVLQQKHLFPHFEMLVYLSLFVDPEVTKLCNRSQHKPSHTEDGE